MSVKGDHEIAQIPIAGNTELSDLNMQSLFSKLVESDERIVNAEGVPHQGPARHTLRPIGVFHYPLPFKRLPYL